MRYLFIVLFFVVCASLLLHSCSSYSSTTTIHLDSASVSGMDYNKIFELKNEKK